MDTEEPRGAERGEGAGLVQRELSTFWWTMGPTQPLIWVVTFDSVLDITVCASSINDQLRLHEVAPPRNATKGLVMCRS